MILSATCGTLDIALTAVLPNERAQESFATWIDVPASPAWGAAMKTAEEMGHLQDGWDGDAAVAPPLRVVSCALGVLTYLKNLSPALPPARIVPTPLGGILIEWQVAGQYWEAEITEPNQIEWMGRDSDGHFTHWVWPWPPYQGIAGLDSAYLMGEADTCQTGGGAFSACSRAHSAEGQSTLAAA